MDAQAPDTVARRRPYGRGVTVGINEIPLTLAMSDYDHVRDMTSGKVHVAGVALTR